MAALTDAGFRSQRVLPWRVQRLRSFGSRLDSLSRRLARDLKAFITNSGGRSASTTT